MAKGRMLNRKISVDDKVHKLPNDTARLLFTWIIPQLDVNGCFYGEPVLIKSMIFPRREDINYDDIKSYIQSMIDLNLAIPYSSDGENFLYFPGFHKNQHKINPDKEGDSGIPPYYGVTPELSESKDGATPLQDKIKEDKYKIKEDKYKGVLPKGLDENIFEDFIEFRKSIKKPLTEKAIELAINKLKTLQSEGNDPKQVIEQSIMNGWQGLFPLKDRNNGTHKTDNKKTGDKQGNSGKDKPNYFGGKYGHLVKH